MTIGTEYYVAVGPDGHTAGDGESEIRGMSRQSVTDDLKYLGHNCYDVGTVFQIKRVRVVEVADEGEYVLLEREKWRHKYLDSGGDVVPPQGAMNG